MNNLGIAYSDLPTGDRGENLKKAIESYNEALKFYTIDAFPYDYKRVKRLLEYAVKKATESMKRT